MRSKKPQYFLKIMRLDIEKKPLENNEDRAFAAAAKTSASAPAVLPGSAFTVRDGGMLSYEQAWQWQRQLLEERAADKIGDTLLLVEHPPVYTFGRKTAASEQPKEIAGVPVYGVERGGEVTFHGPGQLVAYPIFKIERHQGARGFLRKIEKVVVDTLRAFAQEAFLIEGATGVWLKDQQKRDRKIASIGIAVRKGVCYHGVALNVACDLQYFRQIQPCGFSGDVMINLQDLEPDVSFAEAKIILLAAFTENFTNRHPSKEQIT